MHADFLAFSHVRIIFSFSLPQAKHGTGVIGVTCEGSCDS